MMDSVGIPGVLNGAAAITATARTVAGAAGGCWAGCGRRGRVRWPDRRPRDQNESTAYRVEFVSLQFLDFAVFFNHGTVPLLCVGGPFRRHMGNVRCTS